MNGVQTRFKCKLDVKRCKRFVFPPSSLLPRSNALKTKAIRYFQTDRTLTRIVSPPLDVELDGRWDDPIRSAATNCPITVFTDGYLLTLKNASPDRDMTIRITDMAKGGVVYENDIPEVQSAYITISIANFPAEEYKLEITGTPSGHLTGYFTKE